MSIVAALRPVRPTPDARAIVTRDSAMQITTPILLLNILAVQVSDIHFIYYLQVCAILGPMFGRIGLRCSNMETLLNEPSEGCLVLASNSPVQVSWVPMAGAQWDY